MSPRLLLTLFWLVTTTLCLATEPLQRRSDIVHGQFDNGLSYYIMRNAHPKGEAVYRLWVKSGSLNEEDDQLGLAHFLEHMAFNGSEHFPGEGMVRFLERHGAKFGQDLNAHTTFDETVYKLQLPSSDALVVDSTLQILADWAYGLSLDADEVEKERGVILSEWLTKQNKEVSTNQALLDALFLDSRYAERPTIGDTAIIAHASPATLRRYYERCYRPEQMAVAVVGDIDPSMIEVRLSQLFSAWKPSSKASLPQIRYTIPPYKKERAHLAIAPREKKIQLEMIRRIEPVGAIDDSDDMHDYVLRLMASRLIRQRLAHYSFEKCGYSDAQMGRGSFVRGGDVWLTSITLPREDIRAGILSFLAHQQQMLQYGFTEREIASVRQQLLQTKRRKLRYPTPSTSSSLMQELYNDYMLQACCISDSAELSFLEQELPRIDSVQLLLYLKHLDKPRQTHYLLHGNPLFLDEIPDQKTLLRIIRQGRRVAVAPYADDASSSMASLSLPNSDDHHILRTDTIPEVQAIRWRLDNGSDVIYRRSANDHERLLLTGFREGGLYHLDSLDYLSGLYASSIVPISGAGSFTREGLSDYLKGSSASMSMLVDKKRTGISGAARTEDVAQLFQLLYTKWTEPRLDSAAYNRVIELMRKEISTRIETPDDRFKQDCSRLLQAESYTNRKQTLEELDARVKAERMLPIYHELFGSAEGFHFILAGDLPTDSVRHWVDFWLGALPSGAKHFEQQYHPVYPLSSDTTMISSTEAEKAVVSLYWQGSLEEILYAPNSCYQSSLQRFQLYTEVAKGIMTARLRQILREEMSMTYSVNATHQAALYPAPLSQTVVSFTCLPEHTDTLLLVTHATLQELIDEPESFRQTFEDVRSNLKKKHALDIQKNTWWTSYIRNLIYNRERDWDFVNQYDALLDALSPADVAETMRLMLSQPCLTTIK